jgi:hypothetical protein
MVRILFRGRRDDRWRRFWPALVSMAILGLAFVAGAAAADNPALPPVGSVIKVPSYNLTDAAPDPVLMPNAPPGNGSTLLWGYEANFVDSRIRSYNIAPYAQGPDCVPNYGTTGNLDNGRGVAYDPLDGNLWTTRLTFFTGDGFIHKVTPPNVTPAVCPQVKVIPFGDGPGGTIQDDIGALDIDQGSKHIWAAGYFPISVGGGAERNYFYLVDRNNGKILQSCWVPSNPDPEDQFNDSLTYARLKGLPGSGEYLLSDVGEFFGSPLRVIDTSSCHNGGEATVVAEFPTPGGHAVTGIDFEWPGLLNTDMQNLYNNGDQPFATDTVIGPTNAPFGLEDISLCAFRAKFGGDGNDMCRY